MYYYFSLFNLRDIVLCPHGFITQLQPSPALKIRLHYRVEKNKKMGHLPMSRPLPRRTGESAAALNLSNEACFWLADDP